MIIGFVCILVVGFLQVFNNQKRLVKKLNFSDEYRNKFAEFSNKYFKDYDRWSQSGEFDGELYVWLTMNVNKMQEYLGTFGVVEYLAPFQTYKVSNYQVVINTLPLFRDGKVKSFDVNSVDDCLLRYIGFLDNIQNENFKNIKNPVIWFREGIREILSIPIFLLSWFGIISNRAVDSIKNSLLFKLVAGLISLVTFISGLVTIIVGKDLTLEFIQNLLKN
jgi:hypothetical protein